MLDIIAVPAIASLVFSIMEIYKRIIKKSKHEENLLRIIPIVGGVLGIIAGVVCFFACPAIIAAEDIVAACLVGGASGLSATGCNQLFKQLHKFGIKVKTDDDESIGV